MKKEASKGLTQKQRAEIEALANLPDETIDTGDIPEIVDWTGARRGLLYRPIKQQNHATAGCGRAVMVQGQHAGWPGIPDRDQPRAARARRAGSEP